MTEATSQEADEGAGDVAEDGSFFLAPAAVQALTQVAIEARSGRLSFHDLSTEEENTACAEAAGLDDHEVVGEVEEDEVVFLLMIPEGTELGPDSTITFVDTETCEIVLIDE